MAAMEGDAEDSTRRTCGLRLIQAFVGLLVGAYATLLLRQHAHLWHHHRGSVGDHSVHQVSFRSGGSNSLGGGAGGTTGVTPPALRPPALGRGGSASATASRPRIIFAVPMPWPLKDDLAKDNLVATISTWGSHADELILIVSKQQVERFPPDSELGARHSQIKNYLHTVPMQRPDGISNGRHIWEKMWRGWKLVGDRYRDKAEWFVKADLDTFVAVENMRAFLSHLDPDKPYYFGHTLFHDWDLHNLVFNSGTCYVLSREALRRLSIRLARIESSRRWTYQCGDGPGAREDPHTASCLRDVGVLSGDSLDATGRQRFLTFRPKDHLFAMKVGPKEARSWFWRYKDTSKQLLECCSNYPISYHNFKSHPRVVYEPEAYYELEYFLSSRPFEAIVQGMDPPRGGGQLFQYPDTIARRVDKDRNIGSPAAGKRLGNWLQENKDARDCVERAAECTCRLPSGPPLGTGTALREDEAAGCGAGGALKIGHKCEIVCADGYESVGAASHSKTWVSCYDGALLWPSDAKGIVCERPCAKDAFDTLSNTAASQGDVARRDKDGRVRVRCGAGRVTVDGKKETELECVDGSYTESSQGCGKCVRWTVTLKGSSYTHSAWAKMTFDGSENTEFEVAPVKAGSPQDPVKNCQKFNRIHQLVLRVRRTQTIVAALSCDNQMIDIENVDKIERDCR